VKRSSGDDSLGVAPGQNSSMPGSILLEAPSKGGFVFGIFMFKDFYVNKTISPNFKP
jgi:hypothetical protein